MPRCSLRKRALLSNTIYQSSLLRSSRRRRRLWRAKSSMWDVAESEDPWLRLRKPKATTGHGHLLKGIEINGQINFDSKSD